MVTNHVVYKQVESCVEVKELKQQASVDALRSHSAVLHSILDQFVAHSKVNN